jgi:hypothetical protein
MLSRYKPLLVNLLGKLHLKQIKLPQPLQRMLPTTIETVLTIHPKQPLKQRLLLQPQEHTHRTIQWYG